MTPKSGSCTRSRGNTHSASATSCLVAEEPLCSALMKLPCSVVVTSLCWLLDFHLSGTLKPRCCDQSVGSSTDSGTSGSSTALIQLLHSVISAVAQRLRPARI